MPQSKVSTIPDRSFGDTIPVPTKARVHFLSSKLWYNTTIFGCHAILLVNFWYLHTTTIFEDTFRPHPQVRLHPRVLDKIYEQPKEWELIIPEYQLNMCEWVCVSVSLQITLRVLFWLLGYFGKFDYFIQPTGVPIFYVPITYSCQHHT
jgi:hypothetical protein